MMHSVTEEELSTLRAVIPSTAVAFLGVAIGAALAFYTALQTTTLDHDTRSNFNTLFWGARIGVGFFAILSIWGYAHLALVIHRIKKRPRP